MSNESLWPSDFGVPDSKSPITILRKQAAILGQMTSNVLEGEVLPRIFPTDSDINITFYIKAPVLEKYRYSLFTAIHSIEKHYPLKISRDNLKNIDNETEFCEELHKIFASERTKKVIQSLLQQSIS